MFSGWTVFRNSMLCSLLWMSTHENRFTRYLGHYQMQFATLIFGAALGLVNASAILRVDHATMVDREPNTKSNGKKKDKEKGKVEKIDTVEVVHADEKQEGTNIADEKLCE